jgi:DNA repair protein RecO (recombination protein O)
VPAQVSECFILRTYPLKESDLIVSFFTRDHGKLRGVAKRARRPKSNFGAGLERLSQVRMTYTVIETRELAHLQSCELIASPFGMSSDYGASLALDFITEVSEHLLPPHEANEKVYRLLVAVVEELRRDPAGATWKAILYFSLWIVRLSGFLPEMRLDAESVAIANEMMTTPIGGLAERAWTKNTAADLRRRLVRLMEQQVERKLLTAPLLEAL